MRTLTLFARWFVGGYALGFIGWLVLAGLFVQKDWAPRRGMTPTLDSFCDYALFGFLWAIPWAATAGFCGLVAPFVGPKRTVFAAFVGLAIGVGMNLRDCSTVDGWMALTMPIYGIPTTLAGVASAIFLSALFRAT